MKTYTINDFHNEWLRLNQSCKSYRVGQHFIKTFLVNSSSTEMCKLWEETTVELAYNKIHEIIEQYNWDYNDLPVLKDHRSYL